MIREEFKIHSLAAMKKTVKRARRECHQVRYVKIDPQVWKLAKKLANGEVSRIEIISETEVIVR